NITPLSLHDALPILLQRLQTLKARSEGQPQVFVRTEVRQDTEYFTGLSIIATAVLQMSQQTDIRRTGINRLHVLQQLLFTKGKGQRSTHTLLLHEGRAVLIINGRRRIGLERKVSTGEQLRGWLGHQHRL